VPAPLVVHVIYRLDIGGLENGLVNLLNLLPRQRYRQAVVCLAGVNPRFRERIRDRDIEVVSLDKRPGKDLHAYVRMYRALRRLRADVVHTRNIGTMDMQWVAAAARVRRRVHGEHGWDAGDPRGLNRKSLLIRRGCRPVIQRYLAMSRDIARWLVDVVGARQQNVSQIYNGVDTSRFSPQGPVPADLPWSADMRRSMTVFGTVGRLDPVKNQRALLDAFAVMLRDRAPQAPAARLAIVGGGPMLRELQEHARQLGIADSLWLPGPRDDIADIQRAIDVFVLPSINEGISNTLLEAMASARPVIAGAVGGNVEIVLPGKTGELCDPTDPAALADAMRRYLESPALRAQHGAAAQQHVRENFSLEAMINGYASFYDSVMSDRWH
jgi:sugar transferase (PEP-CTERM/EpsH1 system associated)